MKLSYNVGNIMLSRKGRQEVKANPLKKFIGFVLPIKNKNSISEKTTKCLNEIWVKNYGSQHMPQLIVLLLFISIIIWPFASYHLLKYEVYLYSINASLVLQLLVGYLCALCLWYLYIPLVTLRLEISWRMSEMKRLSRCLPVL